MPLATLTILLSFSGHLATQERLRVVEVPMTACVVTGEQIAAEYVEEHAGWVVISWECGK